MPASKAPEPSIIDIRRDSKGIDIINDIHEGLRPKNGAKKTLPTLLLYDAKGLKLFEQITYLDQYYPTNAEIEVLSRYAERIAARIRPGSVLVELGSGNLRKVSILLEAVERLGIDVNYFALDVSLSELERTLNDVPSLGSFKHVRCFGLHGTYEDGLKWLQSDDIKDKPKTLLWLGSSIGNFPHSDAIGFLQTINAALQPDDTLVVGIDACSDAEKVFHAYNDRAGTTHKFILNGLSHASRLLRDYSIKEDDWEVIGKYNVEIGRHEAYLSPKKDLVIDDVIVRVGEHLKIEESNKYSTRETKQLWEKAEFNEICKWSNSTNDYGLHMAIKPKAWFPLDPALYAASPIPSLDDWKALWSIWDYVTHDMIPEDMLHDKPIDLRHQCIFYLGHIPTFLDIHLTRATDGKPTEPAFYRKIFERGIDPDVDNPDICHDHSEVPDSWPPINDIIEYGARIRNRVFEIYESNAHEGNSSLSNALWLGFEHEAMHLETLLYMLAQCKKTLPPPDVTTPDFEAIALHSKINSAYNEWFQIPESEVKIGLSDSELTDKNGSQLGWDAEKPARTSHVKSFLAKGRPITNGEYAQYLANSKQNDIPASWCELDPEQNENGHGIIITGTRSSQFPSVHDFMKGKYVKTVHGLVPLAYAMDWPVAASYDELAGCAQWMGGRIPTQEEVRSIYLYVERTKKKEAEKEIGKKIPAVNSHLVNDGVEETPPSNGFKNGSSDSALAAKADGLFINLGQTNIGFKHWHPTPVVQNGTKLAGQGDLGGVWEWTSTVLEKQEGFVPMKEYPGYSADFFDGKHNIVLGGSWATHPRLAGRTTFVNWYQHNYRYMWAGARVVRDI